MKTIKLILSDHSGTTIALSDNSNDLLLNVSVNKPNGLTISTSEVNKMVALIGAAYTYLDSSPNTSKISTHLNELLQGTYSRAVGNYNI